MNILKPYIIELAKTLTGHWYNVWKAKPNGSKGRFLGCFPSSTTILLAYPQSPHLTQWIAERGWHESQRIKSEAGERGTRVHDAIDCLLRGNTLMENSYSLEEWVKIKAFVDWYEEYRPEILATEMSLFSRKYKYAGRVDCIAKVAGELCVMDWKTSGSIHENFPLQFASYAQAIEEMTDLKIVNTGCLQLGAKNKSGFKFIIYPDWKDHLKVFNHVRATWQYDYFDSKKNPKEPPVLELPATLKLSKIEKGVLVEAPKNKVKD